MKPTRLLLLIAAATIVFAWGVFIWPTPWEHYKLGQQDVRVNRFTGQTEYLTLKGWREDRTF